MRRVCYGVATSLDGYIAGPQGEADWIVIDPQIDFASQLARFDTFLVGRRTWEAMGGARQRPSRSTVVFSRTLRAADHPRLRLVSQDAGQAVRRLKEEPGKEIALFGGGDLFRSLLQEGVVDTVEVAVIPVLLGGGVPLLPSPAPRTRLRFVRQRVYEKTGTLSLEYEVERAG